MQRESTSNPKSGSLKSLKIGVLCGGGSSERKISLRSGRAVIRALKQSGFSVCAIDPSREKEARQAYQKIDLAFIALHGRGGEDGSIQSRLEKLKIPYVGSDARSSRLAFDKILAKRVFGKKRIPTPSFKTVPASRWKRVCARFKLPFFVKPPQEGSSIGIYEVRSLKESADKIKTTARRYGTFLIEEKIVGREFTVGILGSRALPVVELRPKHGFYDYRSKYTKGMTSYLVPAPISRRLARKLQKTALAVHQALGLRDFSRVDFMVDEKEKPYVLEANSIPGFTELSLLPKAARAAGISFEGLCHELVRRAFQRRIHKIEEK